MIHKRLFLSALFALPLLAAAQTTTYTVEDIGIDGGVLDGRGRISINAVLGNPIGDEPESPLVSFARQSVRIGASATAATQTSEVAVEVKNGTLEEAVFRLGGDFEILDVTGPAVSAWAVERASAVGERRLVVRPAEPMEEGSFTFTLSARATYEELPAELRPLSLVPVDAGLLAGELLLEAAGDVAIEGLTHRGLAPRVQPEAADRLPGAGGGRYEFLLAGGSYSLGFTAASTGGPSVLVEGFRLAGELGDEVLAFRMRGSVEVLDLRAPELVLLGGEAGLLAPPSVEGAEIEFRDGRYFIRFEEPGRYPLDIRFHARVLREGGVNRARFEVLPSPLQPLRIAGLPDGVSRVLLGGTPLEAANGVAEGNLRPDRPVELTWADPSAAAADEAAARLFYSVENIGRVALSAGILRQTDRLQFQVLQGGMDSVSVAIEGAGDITRVAGPQVLAWRVEEAAEEGGPRRLRIELNRTIEEAFTIELQSQAVIDGLPATVQPLRLVPEGAIRYGGFLQVLPVGAVAVDVPSSSGLAQVAADFLPEKAFAPVEGPQLAFRFSSGDYRLELRAEDILPEVALSQILVYRLGLDSQSIEADLVLNIREAPLREFVVEVPSDFPLSTVEAPALADYFVTSADDGVSRLRLVFGEPVMGQQLVRLVMERNAAFEADSWNLPPVRVQEVRSLRGHIGVVVEPGLRAAVSVLEGLTEQAAGFFPKRLDALQVALRVREPGWTAVLAVERLPEAVQVEGLHLFSVAEGVVFGSSVMNALVTGAPVGEFTVAVPQGAQNIDFSGRDIRSWEETEPGVYAVRLHQPVSGPYTLLCTYEAKFAPRGDLVAFTGARLSGVEAEQGYAIVVSDFPFQVERQGQSPESLFLEPTEIPAEIQLLYDSQVLAACQYSRRPFAIDLQLTPFDQAETARQIVDYADFKTRISRDGEILTRMNIMLKNKGATHFRMRPPADTRLWAVRIAGKRVTPITDGDAILIPLPPTRVADEPVHVDVEVAAQARDAERPRVVAPGLDAPALMVNWELSADPGYVLSLRGTGPASAPPGGSGFDWLRGVFDGSLRGEGLLLVAAMFALLLAALFGYLALRPSPGGSLLLRLLLGFAALAVLAVAIKLLPLGSSPAAPQPDGRQMLELKLPVEIRSAPLAIDLENREADGAGGGGLLPLWPALIGLALVVVGWGGGDSGRQPRLMMAGWFLVFVGALNYPGGPGPFFAVLALFLLVHFGRYVLNAGMPGVAALVVAGACIGLPGARGEVVAPPMPDSGYATASLLDQRLSYRDETARVEARLEWSAAAGDRLLLLRAPATLTGISGGGDAVRLLEQTVGGNSRYVLEALEDGEVAVEFSYQVGVAPGEAGVRAVSLPVTRALAHRMSLAIAGDTVGVESPQAVSVRRAGDGGDGNRFELVFRPSSGIDLVWRPESRDTRKEDTVFHAETASVLSPLAGLVDGAHRIAVRPAQGRVGQLRIALPEGMTITSASAANLESWRFDPDRRLLQLAFQPAHERPFEVMVRSQYATGALPYDAAAAPITVEGAASQLSQVALATGDDVQLGEVSIEGATAMNLGDFPSAVLAAYGSTAQILDLRRAYRWEPGDSALRFEARAVEPDVRVLAQQTVSLGEDRLLLAADLGVTVTRAGVFRLSVPIPEGFDVETASGPQLSHWNEIPADDGEGRVLVLHLRGRAMGELRFNVTMTGAGLAGQETVTPPVLAIAESSRYRGIVTLAPETGFRLRVTEQESAVQLDPAQQGVRQKNVLMFRALNRDARLAFAVEVVAPWVKLEQLQTATLRNGWIENGARFALTVENAGVRELALRLPEAVMGVNISGEPVADFRRDEDDPGLWRVRLDQKRIGNFFFDLAFQVRADGGPRATLSGVVLEGVNQHAGYLAVGAGGRLQVDVPELPAALQTGEAQMVPAGLRGDRTVEDSTFVFRVLDPGYTVALEVRSHDAAELVAAQVDATEIVSTLSAGGSMVTRVALTLDPGDKRMLRIALPDDSRFWFAFVNNQSSWAWREGEDYLIQLERNAIESEPTRVEFTYSTDDAVRAGNRIRGSIEGPRLDLPLENVTWRLNYPAAWRIDDWDGTLAHKEEQDGGVRKRTLSLKSYQSVDESARQAQRAEAENLLREGNQLLQQGRQVQARAAFGQAYKLSEADAAFNEDARVQLQNLREQQALVGIANRRNSFINNNGVAIGQAAQPQVQLDDAELMNFTADEAQQLLGGNTTEDNAALRELAQRLVRQQESALADPQAIMVTLPEHGHTAAFTRSLQIDDRGELRIDLRGRGAAGGLRFSLVLGLALLALLVAVADRVTRARG